jgi:pimeloyl-ACP methyl ester carboxylesterase
MAMDGAAALRFRRRLNAALAFGAAVAVGGIVPAAVAAPVEYDYTGSDFTSMSCFAPSCTDLFTPSDYVSGDLVLNNPLPASARNYLVISSDIASYSFNDGVDTISNTDTGAFFYAGPLFATNASGQITGASVQLYGTNGGESAIFISGGGDGAEYFKNVGDGAAGNSTPGTWTLASSTPPPSPPTLRQLAQASGDVYSGDSSPTADGVSPTYSFLSDNCVLSCTAGSRATAYISPDGSQIIVAIRGTSLTPVADFKDLLADGSFGTGIASFGLQAEVAAAATFLQQIRSENPNATITLTGHSLGGAIAQMLAKYSGLNADTFNAPGSGALYDQLISDFAPVVGGSGASITNYRIYGDQYGLYGMTLPGVTTITLPSIVSNSVVDTNPGEYVILNHEIATVFTQVTAYENGYISPEISVGPNITAELATRIVTPVTIHAVKSPLSVTVIALVFTALVTGAEEWWFDPSGGTDFLFTEDGGSPNFACLNLPVLTNVDSYDVRSEIGTSWSSFENLATGGQACFNPGTDGLEFQPLDLSGQGTNLMDEFLFGLTFASSGDFSGTLTETIPNPAPEPSSLALFILPVLALPAVIWRRRRHR